MERTLSDNKFGRMLKRVAPAVAVLQLAVMSGCSGKEVKTRETLTVEPDVTPEMPKKTETDVTLTPLGIKPVKVGMRIAEIQPKVENLYDTIVREEGYDSNSYYFMLGGNKRFTAYEFESGVVNVLSAEARSVVVNAPDGCELRLGDSFRKVLGLKGVNSVWQSADGEGMWCWNWQGIWFVPDQNDLPDVLAHKLYNQTSAPRVSDFPEDVEIGYIGTGLPW